MSACPACGARVARTARFCTGCGGRLEAAHAVARRRGELEVAQRVVAAIGLVVLGTFALVAATALAGERTLRVELGFELGLAALGLGAARVLGPRGPREALGGGAGPLAVLAGVAGGLASFAVGWGYATAVNALSGAEAEPLPADELPLLLVTVALLPALAEEWLYRGALWVACRRAVGVTATIVVTALVFALLHGLGGGFVLELPHRFIAGLVLGFLRARTGSLAPCVVAHLVNNALAVLVA